MTKTIEQRGKDKNDDQAHAWKGLSNRKKGETRGTGKGKKIDEKKEFLTLPPPQGWASRPTVRPIWLCMLEDGVEMLSRDW